MSQRALLLLLLMLTIAVFAPDHGAVFVWDDSELIGRNDFASSWANLPLFFRVDLWHGVPGEHLASFYRPLMQVEILLDRSLFGDNAAAMQLHSLVWHLGTVTLLYLFLRQKFALGAIAGAAFFALHPFQAETARFIVARNEPGSGQPQLVGITDVSMLRPQVFALQTGHVSHGAIASEKQAIDAFFEEVSSDDARVPTVADRYWAARGGSFTDGGAFSFTLRGQPGERSLVVRDKFGSEITAATSGVTGAAREDSGGTLQRPFEPRLVRPGATPGAAPEPPTGHRPAARGAGAAAEANADQPAEVDAGTSREEATAIAWLMEDLQREDFASFSEGVERLTGEGGPGGWHTVLSALTFLRDDRRWRLTGQRHASLLTAIDAAVVRVLDDLPGPGRADERAALRLDQSWPWTSPPPAPAPSPLPSAQPTAARQHTSRAVLITFSG